VTERLDRVENPPNLSAAPPLLVAFKIYLRNALMLSNGSPDFNVVQQRQKGLVGLIASLVIVKPLSKVS